MAELDLDALKLAQNARHATSCAYERWARRTDYTRPPGCDCDWPAILAGLEQREGLLREIPRLIGLYDDVDLVANPDTDEQTIIAAAMNFPWIAAALLAAREPALPDDPPGR